MTAQEEIEHLKDAVHQEDRAMMYWKEKYMKLLANLGVVEEWCNGCNMTHLRKL